MITCAIGDIHGCFDQLQDLITKVQKIDQIDKWVFLGDYIDRGPKSKEVIDFLMKFEKENNCVILRGNHEEMLIDTITECLGQSWWVGNGGDTTLDSFKLTNTFSFPLEYLHWMKRLPYYHDDGKRFFVHAGVNQKPPENSPKDTMLWVRHSFLTSNKSWGRFVVHGHTPNLEGKITSTPYRLNLDTGCVFGGKLSAALFNDTQDAPYSVWQVDGYDYMAHIPVIK